MGLHQTKWFCIAKETSTKWKDREKWMGENICKSYIKFNIQNIWRTYTTQKKKVIVTFLKKPQLKNGQRAWIYIFQRRHTDG